MKTTTFVAMGVATLTFTSCAMPPNLSEKDHYRLFVNDVVQDKGYDTIVGLYPDIVSSLWVRDDNYEDMMNIIRSVILHNMDITFEELRKEVAP